MGLFSGITKAIKKVVGGVSKVVGGITGGDLLSTGLSFLGGERANEASARSSYDQMRFQEYMSGSAHQREVADLIKAGLNPILSTHGAGASTPGGSSYTAQDTLSPAVNTAFKSKELRAQVENMAASTDKTRSDTALNFELMRSARADQALKTASARSANVNAALAAANLPLATAKGKVGHSALSILRDTADDYKSKGFMESTNPVGGWLLDKLGFGSH